MTLDNKYENNIIMDKENLKVKVEALKANEETAREALESARTQRLRAEVELANADKPVISESLVEDLVDQLTEMFSDVMCNIDTSDLDTEFGINGCEIYLEHLDTSNIGVSDHDIQCVLEEFFAVKADEKSDNS